MGEATVQGPSFARKDGRFQSTLPVGEATWNDMPTYNGKDISIHASRGGSDPFISGIIYPQERFQSTLPVGEATVIVRDDRGYPMISIHASRGGSDIDIQNALDVQSISIHASPTGSDAWRAGP